MRASLRDMLAASPFQAYAYSYPHKTAYRPFHQPRPLEQVWSGEDTRALFLYVHVPFRSLWKKLRYWYPIPALSSVCGKHSRKIRRRWICCVAICTR